MYRLILQTQSLASCKFILYVGKFFHLCLNITEIKFTAYDISVGHLQRKVPIKNADNPEQFPLTQIALFLLI